MTAEVALDVSAFTERSGGAGRYAHGLIEHLPQAGVRPLLIARRGDRASWPPSLDVRSIAPNGRPARLVWEQSSLLRSLRRDAPHVRILHSPHYTMPRPSPSRSSAPRVASVVTVHDLTFFTHPSSHVAVKRRLFTRAIRYAASHADAVVCVSDRTARELREHVTVSAPVHVIPHGVDHDRFTPDDAGDDRAVREHLGVERRYVLHVGTIEPRKNVDGLLRAYEALCASGGNGDLELVLAGGAWPGERERLPVIAHGRVRHLAFVPHDALAALYRGAAVVAYPSLAEGFGLPVLEALACGVPVVTTAGSVMHELAPDAVLAVDTSDPLSLTDALRCALDGGGPRSDTRIAAARRYTWDACARAHAAVYAALLARPAR